MSDVDANQRAHKARLLRKVRRAVVKVGSNVLAGPNGLLPNRVRTISKEIAKLVQGGREIVLVTSGAVASGAGTLGRRKPGIEWRQAAAAVGQINLMAAYQRAFAKCDTSIAQVLLTSADLEDRRRYLNARHTLRALLDLGVVPIVNENDTVAVEELRFGDNDNLSALTATLIDADLLVILTDVSALFDRDPRIHSGTARRVPIGRADDPRWTAAAGGSGSALGTGGMSSKLAAARIAAAAGIPTILAHGGFGAALPSVFDPTKDIGTLLLADGDALTRRKHWIAYTLKPAGTLTVDAGARRALIAGKRSLLPSGVLHVDGSFGVGDCVRCVDPDGHEIARGLVSYPAAEIRKLCGAHTREIAKRLGYKGSDEIIHRDDLVVVASDGPTPAA